MLSSFASLSRTASPSAAGNAGLPLFPTQMIDFAGAALPTINVVGALTVTNFGQ
jgi:hypothetical protein